MWKSCGAVSFNKVKDDLNMKVPHVEGYICSIFDAVLADGRINYMVSEYRITVTRRVSNVVFASHWAKELTTFKRNPEIVEVVHHEVPASSMVKRQNVKVGDYAFMVSDVQPRKNPDLWIPTIQNLKFKVLGVTKPEWCAKLSKLPNFQCIGTFGNVDPITLNTYMANARVLLWMTGGEGFGLPPLEASYWGVFPVALRIPPLIEWFPKDLQGRLVKPKGVTTAPGFLRDWPYVVYRFDPFEFAEVANQVFFDDSFRREAGKSLHNYVSDNYTRGAKYHKFYEIAGRVSAIETKAVGGVKA